ncbi:MAG: hypothetical protein Q4D23_10120, partial [Bacteroidales bacterium]|nr:hypothetical protein [Bacteroidales bacterium]
MVLSFNKMYGQNIPDLQTRGAQNQDSLLVDSLAQDSTWARWEMYMDEATVVGHKSVVKFTTDKVNYRVKDDPD